MPRMTVMTVEKQKKKKIYVLSYTDKREKIEEVRKFTVIAVILDTFGSHVIRERIGFFGRCYRFQSLAGSGKVRME